MVQLVIFQLYNDAEVISISGDYTSNFEFWSFPASSMWYDGCSLDMLASSMKPQLPVSHTVMQADNQCSTVGWVHQLGRVVRLSVLNAFQLK
jgi:hypothetical protein